MLTVNDFIDTFGRRVVPLSGLHPSDHLSIETLGILLKDMLAVRNTLPGANNRPIGANRFYAQHVGGHYYLRSPESILREVARFKAKKEEANNEKTR